MPKAIASNGMNHSTVLCQTPADTTYQLQSLDTLLDHWPGQTRLLRDYTEGTPSDIDALVASGDCFITLATVLDEITESLRPPTADTTTYPQLEKLTRTLLYMQRYYEVVPKRHPDHRQ